MHLSDMKPCQSTENLMASTIIQEDLKRHGYEGDIQEHLQCVAKLVEEKKSVLLRFSDTVFLCTTVEPNVFYVHLYTVDPIKKLAGAINAGVTTVKYAGVKKLMATTTNEMIIKMLKRMGYPVEVQQHGCAFSWSMEINSEI